jgi:AGCS family alanine or glycine:cation symporter
MISTASRVGTGNIAGVATAIGLGGPGAVFWMWLTAVIGGASAFVESTLAQIYKRREGNHFRGGPAYYIQSALGSRKFGIVFAVFLILCFAYGFNPLQAYNMGSTLEYYIPGYYGTSAPLILGAILAVLAGLVIFGGVHRIGWANSRLVPLMAVIYILLAVVVFFRNIAILPETITLILSQAFDFPAIFGGFAGSCIMQGVKRGLYSNEAGMGSAPNAAAAADVTHPVKQGLVQMLAVFLDTMVICSATAVLILMSGIKHDGALSGMPYMQAAVQNQFGEWGIHFITVSVFLFAFTSLLGNYYYTESNLLFIKNSQGLLRVFRWTAVFAIFIGPQYQIGLAWDMADMFMGFMTLVHLGPLFLLGGIAVKALNDYAAKRRSGEKNPGFKALDIGLRNTEWWK